MTGNLSNICKLIGRGNNAQKHIKQNNFIYGTIKLTDGESYQLILTRLD